MRRAATDSPEAPILEEGSEGVRLMTVHKAKGLEFPVVILADIGCKLSQDDASRYLDSARGLCAIRIGGWSPVDLLEHNDEEARRDEAEGVRLAYVAATRARDLLVVPAVGDGPYDKGWVRPLNRALYPPKEQRQSPASARGVPLFKGKDTVIPEARPDGQQPDASTVRPGAYELTDPESHDEYTVVWWDPLLLETRADDPRGLRREELIAKDARPEDVAADRLRYDTWRQRRAELQAAGAVPSMTVMTATQERAVRPALSERVDAVSNRGEARVEGSPQPVITVEDGALKSPRPSGKRFGTLVHALLASVPLSATRDEVNELATLHARLLASTDEECGAAGTIVHHVLKHPRLAAAREAEANGRRVWREAPVSMRTDAGTAGGPTLVDGQIDLAYETGDGWVVVDFKTDVEMVSAEEAYRQQVAIYVDAVAKATGRPATGVLLRI